MLQIPNIIDFDEEKIIKDKDRLLNKLLLDISQGDSESLAKLYEETKASIFSFSLSLLKNPHDAEDVLHDVIIKIFTNAGSYNDTGKPMAWIITITKNLCLMKIRGKVKTDNDVDFNSLDDYLSQNPNVSLADKIIIQETMKVLSEEERHIVTLHVLGGFKHREIGEFLELPLSTVLSKYNRAIKKLKNAYDGRIENVR